MKIVPASYQIIPAVEGPMEIMKHLERIGRVCYKSEDNITDDSCIKFINTLAQRKHWAMLEHHIFVMEVSREIFEDLVDQKWYSYPEIMDSLKFISRTIHIDSSVPRGQNCFKYIVSGSATAFNNLWWCDGYRGNENSGLGMIWHLLKSYVPYLMMDPVGNDIIVSSTPSKYVRLLSLREIDNLPLLIKRVHQHFSALFTVDRGVTHELVRHRPAAWAQESTRYCNYSKGKHGQEITVIKPIFYEEGTIPYDIWYHSCLNDEKDYMALQAIKDAPQESRSVLPQSTKADIVMTSTISRWRHFFKMRVPKTAHPQMREVSVPLFDEARDMFPRAFDDLSYLAEKGVS